MRTIKLFILSVACLLLNACANIIPLTGGPEDETPPILSKIENKKEKLVLVFNENINLGDVNEIISNIYPSPTYEVKRNKLLISGIPGNDKKQLIYFNNSIQDLNANNPIQEYIYANNVGADTFNYQGKIELAFKPKESVNGCYVLLTNKSVAIGTVEDLYNYEFTKANKEGVFKFGFIKNPIGQRVFAFLDKNNNSIPDTGDYYSVGSIITSDSGQTNYLHYLGNNLVFKDTSNQGVTKEVFITIQNELINNKPNKQSITIRDSLFDYTNYTDSTILNTTGTVLEGEKIYYLAKGKDAPINRYSDSGFSLNFNLTQDSLHPFTNNKGDTLLLLRVIPLKEKSTIQLTQMDSNYRGSVFGKSGIYHINSTNNTITVKNGTYTLFLYEDSNNNAKYDAPDPLSLKPGERIIYNMKDIDISPKLDVEISAQP